MPTHSHFSLARSLLLVVAMAASVRAQIVLSGTYTGQTLNDSVIINPSTIATFTGGTTFTGPTATLGNSAQLRWQQIGTLAGKTITLNPSALIYVTGANNTLTLDATTTVTGNADIYSDSSTGTAITNQGSITHSATSTGTMYARNLTNSGSITVSANALQVGTTSAGYNTTNAAGGTMTATGSGSILYLDGNVDNNGTLTATNSGQLRFRGTNTTANLGNIVLSGGGRALLAGTLDNTAATLTAPTGGPFELLGGRISGGTIASNALSFTTSGGYLDNTTLAGGASLPASTYAYINNSTAVSGGTLTFGTSSYLYLSGTNATLTLGATTTTSGDVRIYSDGSSGTTLHTQGTITHTAGSSGLLYARNLTNSGSITVSSNSLQVGTGGYNTTNTAAGTMTATGSGSILYLDGSVDNNGTLTATNSGQLRFRDTNTTANLGNIVLSGGGRALFAGTLDNTAATLTPPTGGPFELLGGRISGGTIASNALSFTNSGGYLDNTTLAGGASLPASTYAYINNSTAVSGGTLTFGTSSYLYLSGTNATLTLGATTTTSGDVRIYSDSSNGTTLHNQGTISHAAASSGLLYARNLTNSGSITVSSNSLQVGTGTSGYNTTNTAGGTMTATGSGSILYLDGNVDNNGTLTATNSGQLRFRDTNTTANLGNIVLSGGGRALFAGTLDNTAATLTPPTGGPFELLGGRISGGTIASNALSFTTSGGTLNNTTLTGSASLPASTYAYINNSTAVSGGTLTFGTGSYLYLSGTNAALTLDATTTTSGDVRIYSDGSTGTTLHNQGTITHSAASSGLLYARSLTNSGTITVSSSSLQVGTDTAGYASTNAAGGTMTATGSGSILYLDGSVDNNGTLTATNSGQLRFRGTNVTANLGNIVLSAGGRALLAGTLDNSADGLSAPSGGVFELFGGTLFGGIIGSGALSFTTSGGYLKDTLLSGDFALPASAYAYLNNTVTLSSGTTTFNNGSYLYLSGTGATLVIDSTAAAAGDLRIYSDSSAGTSLANQGTLTHSAANSGLLYARALTNSGNITVSANSLQIGSTTAGYNTTNAAGGTMTATGSGSILYLDGNVDNNGTLTATNSGQLRFRGTNTTANLGNIVLSGGGRALLDGTLDNTAATLSSPTGGPLELFGGRIKGGTVGGGSLTFTSSGGYLDNTTLTGTLAFPANTYAYINNSTTVAGGSLSFGGGSYLYLSGTGATLTFDSATTVSGDLRLYSDGSTGSAIQNQGTLTHNAPNSGLLYARDVTNSGNLTVSSSSLQVGTTTPGYNTTNTGTMTATGSGTILYLDGNVDNNGTLAAANSGQIRFRGTNTTANLGTVVLSSGGRALLNGTLDNTAATLTAPSGGAFEMFGGTLTGGTVASGALTFSNAGGTLAGVTLYGTLNVPAGTFGYLGIDNTLAGATVNFGSSSYLYLSGANASLLIDGDSSATGQVRLFSDGSAGSTLTNQGLVTHTSGSSGEMYATNFVNYGTLAASAGTLSLGSTAAGLVFTNQEGAVIRVTGTGTVNLRSPGGAAISNYGRIEVQSGTLLTSSRLRNEGGSFLGGAGTINGAFSLAGATLAPGNSVGTLTITNGNLFVDAPSTFEVELDAGASDLLLFQNPTGTINLGAGLLTLSLTLLSPPTAPTYDLIRIGSGGSGITGTFAGLPNSGDTFTAYHSETPYVFAVNYQANVISINVAAIPEPSTYALLGLGAAALAFLRRRRR